MDIIMSKTWLREGCDFRVRANIGIIKVNTNHYIVMSTDLVSIPGQSDEIITSTWDFTVFEDALEKYCKLEARTNA